MDQQSPPVRLRSRDTLPKPRSNLSQTITISTYIIAILTNTFCFQAKSTPFLYRILWNVSFPSTLIVFEQIFKRSIYSFEEIRHLRTYYNNSFFTLIKDHVNVPALNLVVYILSLSQTIPLLFSNSDNSCNLPSLFFYLIEYFLLKNLLKADAGRLHDSLWLENSHGLDYGSGLAHSFYHGYLKIVIPKTGDGEKHLEELMKDYESKHRVSFDAYKMIILIPKSLYCPVSLSNDYSPSIEESSSLDEIKRTVAGVQNRIYKNSVYKILDNRNVPKYVVAEYATPLKTFLEVVRSNGVHSEYYRKYKNEIVLQFYRTLKQILQEQEACRNFCELIFFDDVDEQGNLRDIGPIILRRLRKIRNSRNLND